MDDFAGLLTHFGYLAGSFNFFLHITHLADAPLRLAGVGAQPQKIAVGASS